MDFEDDTPSGSYKQPEVYESFCNDIHTCSGSTMSSEQMSIRPPESLSTFGDIDCGEPMKAQHLVIDFTLDDEIDTEESQQKCCDFWDYINSHPEIKHLMAMPDPELKIEEWETVTASTPASESTTKENTAIRVLEICEDYDATKIAFAPKKCQTHCDLGPREYIENEPANGRRGTVNQVTELNKPSTSKAPRKRLPCKCHGVCTRCPKEKATNQHQPIAKVEPIQSSPETVAMCQKLTEWDEKHPKCMDPPGPPLEHHPILQRRYPLPID